MIYFYILTKQYGLSLSQDPGLYAYQTRAEAEAAAVDALKTILTGKGHGDSITEEMTLTELNKVSENVWATVGTLIGG